jgi:hypothetical protein
VITAVRTAVHAHLLPTKSNMDLDVCASSDELLTNPSCCSSVYLQHKHVYACSCKHTVHTNAVCLLLKVDVRLTTYLDDLGKH